MMKTVTNVIAMLVMKVPIVKNVSNPGTTLVLHQYYTGTTPVKCLLLYNSYEILNQYL